MAKTINHDILLKQVDNVIKKALQDKKKIEIYNNGVELPSCDDFDKIKKEFTPKKLAEYDIMLRTIVFTQNKNSKTVPSVIENYYVFVQKPTKSLGDTPTQQPQNELSDKYHLLLEDSTNKIQKESDWKMEKLRFELNEKELNRELDRCKEKNIDLLAQYAKLDKLCDGFENSAKNMESKGNFTDAIKGLAGGLLPLLMGGGAQPPAQMMGIEQGQQVEQEPTYTDTLNQMFGDEAERVSSIIDLLAQNPSIIGRCRGWLDTNKPKQTA